MVAGVATVVVALGVAAYAERGTIKEILARSQAPNVPAVNYQQATNPETNTNANVNVPANTVSNTQAPSTGSGSSTSNTNTTNTSKPTNTANTSNTSNTAPATPTQFNLAVPFTSQAPTGNWDAVHEETCEEAAVLMTADYYKGLPAGKLDPTTADADLLKIVDWENKTFGFYKDTTAAQTAQIASDYFHLHPTLLKNPTVAQLKAALVAGHPIVVPAAGRELGNPNFTAPGPIYHNLVLKGYTSKGFITNDPGTHNGADYFYTFDTIMNAMHDWDPTNIDNGAKVVIIVQP